jgi:hypothetical protein
MTKGRILLLLAALAAALPQARAAQLDAESCEKLLNEHGELERAGVEADMAKGPDWAKANLAAEKLARIRRFIDVEAQLLFRCRQRSLVNLPPETEAGSDSKDQGKNAAAPRVPASGGADKAKAPAAAAKKKAQRPARKAAPTRKAAVQQKGKQAPRQARQPPPKAKAAAKQPAGAEAGPAPSAAAGKRAPKAKDEND